MAWFDCVRRSATFYKEGAEHEFKHIMFFEYLEDAKLLVQELFEIDGEEMSAQDASLFMGQEEFETALEVARE